MDARLEHPIKLNDTMLTQEGQNKSLLRNTNPQISRNIFGQSTI